MATRYETIFCKDLPAAVGGPQIGDYRWALVEFVDDKPTRIVGTDGGEPEDQLLVRDWQWVAEEMNRQAKRRDALTFALSRLHACCVSGDLTGCAEAMDNAAAVLKGGA